MGPPRHANGSCVGWQMLLSGPPQLGYYCADRARAHDRAGCDPLGQAVASWPPAKARLLWEKSDWFTCPAQQRCLLAWGSRRRAAGTPLGRPQVDTSMQIQNAPHSTLYTRTYPHALPTLDLDRVLACTLKAGPTEASRQLAEAQGPVQPPRDPGARPMSKTQDRPHAA